MAVVRDETSLDTLYVVDATIAVHPRTGRIVDIMPPRELDCAEQRLHVFWLDRAKTYLRELEDRAAHRRRPRA